MSRSGYSDSCDGWALIRWRGAVKAALRGARGQVFLRELAAAMDAMPEKVLTAGVMRDEDGCLCTLGVVAAARGKDLDSLNRLVGPEEGDADALARELGISAAMAKEVMWENDEHALFWNAGESPEHRWQRMRAWVDRQLANPGADQ